MSDTTEPTTVSVPLDVLERAVSSLNCQIALLEKSIGEATGRRNAGIAEILTKGRENDIKALAIIKAAIKKVLSV